MACGLQDLFASQMSEKNIDYRVVEEALDDKWVLCDKNRLDRVFLNLIGNAYKFTPDGGSVTVTFKELDKSGNTADYQFRVKDSGIGMSPEFAEHLFTPFEREKTSTVSKVQGTGLGMAITKSFVDKMGGTIDVKTKQGEGTTLTIRLNFETAAPEEQPDEEREKGNRTDFRDVRLLLVEDNPINQEIAVMLLSNEGFLVDCAEDGQAAVDAILQAEPGTYDAVLMDIQMPVMDGYQATRTIRALDDPARAGVPIVAMTADAFQEDQKKAYDAGMQGHIAKPIDMKQMLDTLKSILGR
jgi:CheY-like chemotaxis protein